MKETISALIYGIIILGILMIGMFIWQNHYCAKLQKQYLQKIRSGWGGCKIYKQGKWIPLNLNFK